MKIIISSQEMFLTPVTICRELWPGFVVGGFFFPRAEHLQASGNFCKGFSFQSYGGRFSKVFLF